MELDRFSLHGGLGILDGGILEITPGCCCGLEDWRDLLTIPEGDSPWMGHDPNPSCTFAEDRIRFVGDAETEDYIEMSLHDVVDDLRQFHVTLERFISSLKAWLLKLGVTEIAAFMRKFDNSFAISADTRLSPADQEQQPG